jgi:hypothetical protein
MSCLENRLIHLLRSDSYLAPFSDKILHRLENIEETEHRLTQGKKNLTEFASGLALIKLKKKFAYRLAITCKEDTVNEKCEFDKKYST